MPATGFTRIRKCAIDCVREWFHAKHPSQSRGAGGRIRGQASAVRQGLDDAG